MDLLISFLENVFLCFYLPQNQKFSHPSLHVFSHVIFTVCKLIIIILGQGKESLAKLGKMRVHSIQRQASNPEVSKPYIQCLNTVFPSKEMGLLPSHHQEPLVNLLSLSYEIQVLIEFDHQANDKNQMTTNPSFVVLENMY